jgi:hypothetical protein
LFRSYLSNHKQFVKLNGVSSGLSDVTSGVPQGGHLSPLLFCLYVNSISSYLKKAHFLLYADDIKIFLKIETLSDCLLLSNELIQFNHWVHALGLSLHISRCNVISFSRSRNPIHHPYLLNNIMLQRASLIKDLGIYYSFTLSFNHHIDIITRRANKVLGFIKRNTKLFSSPTCLRSLYFALVRSILEYGVVVWHPYLAKDQLRLEIVQHKFLSYAAFILGLPNPNHNYTDISHFLNIPPLLSRRKLIDLHFINSLLENSIDSPDLLSQIQFKVPSHNVRNPSPYYIPTLSASFSHNHPMNRMLRLANQL